MHSVSESPGRGGSAHRSRADGDVSVFPLCRCLGVCLQHRSSSRRAEDLGRVRPWRYRSALSNSHIDCLETAAEQGQARLQGAVFSFPSAFSHGQCKASHKKDLGERTVFSSSLLFVLVLWIPTPTFLFVRQVKMK